MNMYRSKSINKDALEGLLLVVLLVAGMICSLVVSPFIIGFILWQIANVMASRKKGGRALEEVFWITLETDHTREFGPFEVGWAIGVLASPLAIYVYGMIIVHLWNMLPL